MKKHLKIRHKFAFAISLQVFLFIPVLEKGSQQFTYEKQQK